MALTSNKLISDIRNIASSGSNPIEFKIEDSQILFWCNEIRSMLINQQLQKRVDVSDIWLQNISCLELEQVDESECCSIDSNCMILRTVREIPTTIETINDNTIYSVETPLGKLIAKTNMDEERYLSFTKYGKKRPYWFLKNNRIYIINEDFLTHINIWGIFEDPAELKNFVGCDGSTCFSWDDNYPCSLKMANEITNIVLKTKVYPYMSMQADNTNDAANITSAPNTKNI